MRAIGDLRMRFSKRIQVQWKLRFHQRIRTKSFFTLLVKFVPILAWLPRYDWKRSFFGDLSGGLTMAVFAVPQGFVLFLNRFKFFINKWEKPTQ